MTFAGSGGFRVRRAARKDRNHGEIVSALRRVGAVVNDAVARSPCGFDALVGWRGVFRTLEIKDGAKPPSARQLTDTEQRHADACRAAGLPHHVVCSVAEAFAAIGATTP